MDERVVIVHEEMGVFVGAHMGMAYWSMLETAGQAACATFDDEADARNFVSQWDPPQDPNQYRYIKVRVSGGWAPVHELVRVGLADYTRLLLLHTECAGKA